MEEIKIILSSLYREYVVQNQNISLWGGEMEFRLSNGERLCRVREGNGGGRECSRIYRYVWQKKVLWIRYEESVGFQMTDEEICYTDRALKPPCIRKLEITKRVLGQKRYDNVNTFCIGEGEGDGGGDKELPLEIGLINSTYNEKDCVNHSEYLFRIGLRYMILQYDCRDGYGMIKGSLS